MRLHLLGMPHTIHSPAYSHCAFTGKALRFSKMMQARGFEVTEYSNHGSTSDAKIKVPILTETELNSLMELYRQEYPGTIGVMDGTIYKTYEAKLIEQLKSTLEPGDIVCHPFGIMHQKLTDLFPACFHVETGIGYETTFAPYRVYESYAWWHYHQGKDKRYGQNYEWVVPNYYDLSEWTPRLEPGSYILYFGRVMANKGLNVFKEIAKRVPDKEFIICGEGNPEPFLDDAITNLRYHPPVTGLDRDEFLGNAYCMLMPTIFTEPFGGAGVEGMLCGTPLIASDYGAFSETIWHGVTGFRCKTLGDWIYAINQIPTINRQTVAEEARSKYNLEVCGELYSKIFRQILDLKQDGWYNLDPVMAIPPR